MFHPTNLPGDIPWCIRPDMTRWQENSCHSNQTRPVACRGSTKHADPEHFQGSRWPNVQFPSNGVSSPTDGWVQLSHVHRRRGVLSWSHPRVVRTPDATWLHHQVTGDTHGRLWVAHSRNWMVETFSNGARCPISERYAAPFQQPTMKLPWLGWTYLGYLRRGRRSMVRHFICAAWVTFQVGHGGTENQERWRYDETWWTIILKNDGKWWGGADNHERDMCISWRPSKFSISMAWILPPI